MVSAQEKERWKAKIKDLIDFQNKSPGNKEMARIVDDEYEKISMDMFQYFWNQGGNNVEDAFAAADRELCELYGEAMEEKQEAALKEEKELTAFKERWKDELRNLRAYRQGRPADEERARSWEYEDWKLGREILQWFLNRGYKMGDATRALGEIVAEIYDEVYREEKEAGRL